MAKSKREVIREAPINNNCPECYNQDLTLWFYQTHLYARLYHRISPEVTRELICNTCNSTIYPVNWTEDIERSVEYYEKTVHPEKASIRFRPLFYVLLLLAIVVVGALAYALLQGVIAF